MRIIGGEGGGRRLRTPRGSNTRPTSDRVREALFNILAARIPESRFLDLFAGSGAVGLEALSRGAAEAVFVEKRPQAAEVIRRNIEHLKLTGQATLYQADVNAFVNDWSPRLGAFDIVFMDPPYESGYAERTLRGISRCGLLTDRGVVVVESARTGLPPERVERLVLTKRRYYGDTVLSLYQMGEN